MNPLHSTDYTRFGFGKTNNHLQRNLFGSMKAYEAKFKFTYFTHHLSTVTPSQRRRTFTFRRYKKIQYKVEKIKNNN